ncbi:MAG: DNA polymerase III subunit alpha [Marmoricola sp.]
MSDPFVHLHVHSGYSLQYGASHPDVLVERAAEQEMDALALTDRDGVYGAVRFVRACRQAGIRPVLGVDLAVEAPRPGPAPGRRRSPVRGGAYRDDSRPRVTFLASGRTGWAALCRLVSAAHAGDGAAEREGPVCTPELVAGHIAGRDVLVLLGPDSTLGRAATRRRDDLGAATLGRWRRLLGPDQLVCEVVSHRRPGSGPGSAPHAARMAGLARDAGVPVVVSNAVRHADRLDAPVVDVLDAARRLVPLDPRHLDRVNAEAFLKSGKQMHEVAEEVCRYAGLGDRAATQMLAETRRVADRCVLDPRADLGLGEVHFPEPDGFEGAAAADAADTELRARCEAAIGWRYGAAPGQEVTDRLDDELRIIAGLGFASYFLTVAEITAMVRDLGIRCAARGSGAGSLVNHLLGISGVDPIRHGLLMERFCSPLRASLPDIDIDVESARRLEVYDAILDRFGPSRCAVVSMRDTYRVRHAVRDVGAALGLPLGEIDAIAKSFPHIRARDARTALRELPELRTSGLLQADPDFGKLFFRLVEGLDGLPRHIAMHPCGVLLSDTTLLDRTPVEPSLLGYPMSQFDKDDVEDLGLLKLDVLGIRMQSAMAHAVAELRRVEDVGVDLDDPRQVRLDDPDTYELISSARTLGVFQIESPGQRELVGKSGISDFADIITDISLFRPGPVKSDMVTPYLEARHGWSLPTYLHEDLRPILAQTRGVVVFHEQVIEIIARLTGCSLAEADEARRALGSPEGMAGIRTWFMPRALGSGYPLEVVQKVWAVLEGFASFGFCKAHAAAFALPTFQSAWLKAHHPAYFLAGVLTHDPGMYPKRLILDDARQLGIEVLGLDVNASGATYTVERVEEGYGIRLALAEVRGIGDAEVERVVRAREGAPYVSLGDFWQRAAVSRPVVENLVLAGGFDSVHGIGDADARRRGRPTRRDLLLQVVELDRLRRGSGGPEQLVLDLGEEGRSCATGAGSGLSGLSEMTDTERVRAELEVLGLDASRHVLEPAAAFLDDLGVVRSRDLLAQRSRSEILVAGVKVATQTPPIRSGRRVIFLTLDDATGPVDATFFEDVQGGCATTVFGSWLLVVRGVVRRTGRRGVSLRATGAWDLGVLHDRWQREGREAVLAELSGMPGPEEPADRRVLVHSSGFRLSPYSDVRPAGPGAGTVTAEVARKLWHRSPGSSG